MGALYDDSVRLFVRGAGGAVPVAGEWQTLDLVNPDESYDPNGLLQSGPVDVGGGFYRITTGAGPLSLASSQYQMKFAIPQPIDAASDIEVRIDIDSMDRFRGTDALCGIGMARDRTALTTNNADHWLSGIWGQAGFPNDTTLVAFRGSSNSTLRIASPADDSFMYGRSHGGVTDAGDMLATQVCTALARASDNQDQDTARNFGYNLNFGDGQTDPTSQFVTVIVGGLGTYAHELRARWRLVPFGIPEAA